MNRVHVALASAAVCFAGACRAEPQPPAGEDAPPTEEIIIGGSCTYDTAETTARVLDTRDDFAIAMIDAAGETFFLRYSQFADVSTYPEMGRTYRVSKATITEGTCTPLNYAVLGPADEPAPQP